MSDRQERAQLRRGEPSSPEELQALLVQRLRAGDIRDALLGPAREFAQSDAPLASGWPHPLVGHPRALARFLLFATTPVLDRLDLPPRLGRAANEISARVQRDHVYDDRSVQHLLGQTIGESRASPRLLGALRTLLHARLLARGQLPSRRSQRRVVRRFLNWALEERTLDLAWERTLSWLLRQADPPRPRAVLERALQTNDEVAWISAELWGHCANAQPSRSSRFWFWLGASLRDHPPTELPELAAALSPQADAASPLAPQGLRNPAAGDPRALEAAVLSAQRICAWTGERARATQWSSWLSAPCQRRPLAPAEEEGEVARPWAWSQRHLLPLAQAAARRADAPELLAHLRRELLAWSWALDRDCRCANSRR